MSALPCDKRTLRRYVKAGFLERDGGAAEVRQMWQRLDAGARSLSAQGAFKGKHSRPRHADCWAEWLRLKEAAASQVPKIFGGLG